MTGRIPRDEPDIVFSSDDGDLRGQRKPGSGSGPTGDGNVRVQRESSGRRGKTVTTVSGVPLDPAGLAALAKELKRRCGSGGAVKDGVIVIQGDHADALVTEMARRGYAVKRSGG